MTSKELTLRAIEFKAPPRLPMLFFNRDTDRSDVLSTGWAASGSFNPAVEGATEWGYVWKRLDGTMGQPEQPPLADKSLLDSYVPPDPRDPGRMAHVAEWAGANSEKFLRFSLGITGFNQATFLRGFESFLTDLWDDPAAAGKVLDIVFGFENGLIERIADMPLDSIAFGDDWGAQQGLIVSPAMWREVFRPRYEEQFAMVRKAGKKVWFHTCGDVWDIIGDLIDIGVDVLELLQPDVFGVERLGAEYGGHVCFCCAVDHQRLALNGTQDEIRDYVKRLRHSLGRFNGGYIGYVEDYASLGMRDATYRQIVDAFQK